MVAIANSAGAGPVAAPKFEYVNWRQEPHLRKLYLMSFFLLIGAATTGYDGMLSNTCQQMNTFKSFFSREHLGEQGGVFIWHEDTKTWSTNSNRLGIMINMFNIGSIVAFFITPYSADRWGRKIVIMIGCVLMIIGSFISAFTNGYGSRFPPCSMFHVPSSSDCVC